jgi:hypothetical protein
MAAPAAAGIAGLLFSYNPALTNTQVEQALELSAAPVNFTVAYGRVDALAALQYLGASDPQPTSAPVQTAAPQIYYELNGWTSIAPLTGAPQPGQVLVRGIGGWTGSSGLVVSGLVWQRCDANGVHGAWQPVDVHRPDRGRRIHDQAPVQRPELGRIGRCVQEGSSLTTSTGTWNGSPTAYAFQWQRCDSSAANCAAIAGATSSSYVAATTDVGSTLVAVVTASNASGSASAASAPTAVVTSAPASPPPPASPPAMQTQTFTGALNTKNPTRSFSLTMGAGTATAQLAFSKCATLSVALAASSGAPTGNATGPSIVSLVSTVSGGTYTYTVSGGRCSFTLTVTSPIP